MISDILNNKPTKLFVGIAAFFVANALIAECLGTKLFSLEKVFGSEPASFSLFGEKGLSVTLTAGVLLWPLEFIITDIVNEYYGAKGSTPNKLYCHSFNTVCFCNVLHGH